MYFSVCVSQCVILFLSVDVSLSHKNGLVTIIVIKNIYLCSIVNVIHELIFLPPLA